MPKVEPLNDRAAVVVTTVNRPTAALQRLADGCSASSADLVIIGDQKTPPDFSLQGSRYFDVARQRGTGLKYAELCPVRHYARKNIGYLLAIASGAEIIIETDDDNIPLAGFWERRSRRVTLRSVCAAGWVNAYAFFTQARIWPRGLPLNEVQSIVVPAADWPMLEADCPVQQGLANGDPDVDAIYRLVLPLPFDFNTADPIALGPGSWCPFNSQNTTFFAEVFPLLYLPYHCSFRMTDIWRSFVAQAILHASGWSVMFHQATVHQDRNEHDLMRDFRDEIPGYVNNEVMMHELSRLALLPGTENISANLERCYGKLVEMKLLDGAELLLLDAWLQDLKSIRR